MLERLLMSTLEKLDLKKQFKQFYMPPPGKVMAVDVPPMQFLMIDGAGDPNSALEYRQAIEALYGMSYTLKFNSKKNGIDYPVMPLEGLWWMENMGEKFGDIDFAADKSKWLWTAMIMQPDPITQEMVDGAAEQLRHRKNPPALGKVRFEIFHEGLCAQIMHLGPYSAEKPDIEKVHAYIEQHGYQSVGKHHEIYLGDPRRSAPEKLRTVIRQPMMKWGGAARIYCG
jgi:hypothetical protein